MSRGWGGGDKWSPQTEGLSNGPDILKDHGAQGREVGERAQRSLLPYHATSIFRGLRREAMIYSQDHWGVAGQLNEASVGYPTGLSFAISPDTEPGAAHEGRSPHQPLSAGPGQLHQCAE